MEHIQDEIWDIKVNSVPNNDRAVVSDKSNGSDEADSVTVDDDDVKSEADHTNDADDGSDFQTFVGLAEKWLENQSDL